MKNWRMIREVLTSSIIVLLELGFISWWICTFDGVDEKR